MTAAASCLSRIRRSAKLRQMLAAGAASHGALIMGTMLGWGPAAFRTIVEEMEDISFNQLWTWAMLGVILSIIPAGYAADKFGRKIVMLALCIPCLVGWICIIFAGSPTVIYMGRFLTGLSAGGCSVVVPLYMSETSQDKFRGLLGFMFQQQILGGALLGYMSPHDSWRLLTGKAMPIPIVFIIFMHFMPESPLHLLRVGKTMEAMDSLKWLRAAQESEPVDVEFKEIQQALEYGGSSPNSSPKVIFSSSILRPIVTCMAFMIFNAFSGVGILTLYTMAFTTPVVSVVNNSSNFLYGIRLMYLTQAGGPPGLPISSNTLGIIMTVVPLVAMGIGSAVLAKRKRRPVLTISSVCMSACLIALGALNCVQSTEVALYWGKFTVFVSLFLASSFGLGPVPWILMGELLPPNSRGIGSIMVAGSYWIASIVLTYSISLFIYMIGIQYCFWFFACICAIAAVVGHRHVPETGGKSLSEIQEYYSTIPPLAFPM
jgi:SP family facilitated glucose transporter-like MFS transporter 8